MTYRLEFTSKQYKSNHIKTICYINVNRKHKMKISKHRVLSEDLVYATVI